MIMAELVEAQKDSRLLEVFGTGTAAVVSAIDKCVPCFADTRDFDESLLTV